MSPGPIRWISSSLGSALCSSQATLNPLLEPRVHKVVVPKLLVAAAQKLLGARAAGGAGALPPGAPPAPRTRCCRTPGPGAQGRAAALGGRDVPPSHATFLPGPLWQLPETGR